MERKTVGVSIIVCKEDGTWYKDYQFVKTFYPEEEGLAMDALVKFGNNLQCDDVIHMAIMDVTIAVPDEYMQVICDKGDIECIGCPHFKHCFE